ncbi:unnamed protein product [Dimorphilus gyrociliatus]|uniref:BHLH domain-containing protein n=1 Tax=Dimorphilus gyrociliatus TaxID=2664684 RepID=A0A7I8VLK5_9ANNE|nr:unnamed protein product [Dimorphilus gyrociliatus]
MAMADKTNLENEKFERLAMNCSEEDEDMPSSRNPKKANKSAAMVRRNARERNRLKRLNSTFVALQSHLPEQAATATPTQGAGKGKQAMSKVDILRGAIDYIRALQTLLDENGNQQLPPPPSYPSPFFWPST